jgi:hypothetical protein
VGKELAHPTDPGAMLVLDKKMPLSPAAFFMGDAAV